MMFRFPKSPQQRIDAIRFECPCCNTQQTGMMDLAKRLPDPIAVLSEEEQQARAHVSADLCSLDGEHFFVRAILYVPIRKTKDSIGFGVWGSLAEQNFKTYFDEFENHDPQFGPFFSWLCSDLPPYDCGGLESQMAFQPNNKRPLIHLAESDHPLSVAQREGITVDELARIYEAWGHKVLLP
jgi:hypothetical protein